jgi:hypothetical protein
MVSAGLAGKLAVKCSGVTHWGGVNEVVSHDMVD